MERNIGRAPWANQLDFRYAVTVPTGGKTKVELTADVFNLLDRQAVLYYDERYNLFQDGPCAGVPEGLCNGDGGLKTRPGTLEPLGALDDPRHTATNPDYLKGAVAFTGQRSLRLGVRLSF
jgi:hypothetical protein